MKVLKVYTNRIGANYVSTCNFAHTVSFGIQKHPLFMRKGCKRTAKCTGGDFSRLDTENVFQVKA
jgi:hypothetical protein